jgi:Ser/Thr protein kinase RdoA (MazF antagonist)
LDIVPPEDLELLARHLGPIASIEPCSKGSTSSVFKVTSSGGTTYACKRAVVAPSELAARREILRHLKGTPALVHPLDLDGLPFLRGARAVYEIFPWLTAADGLDPRVGHTACGEALAGLHRALSATQSAAHSWLRTLRMDVHPSDIERELSKVGALSGLPARLGVDAEVVLHSLATLISREASRLTDLSALMPQLRRQLIHGDFHLDNVILTPGPHAHIIDLDKLAVGCVAFDLAKFIMCSCFSDTGAYLAPLTEAFAAGYRRNGELAGDDVAAIPGLVLACHTSALWVLRRLRSSERSGMAGLLALYGRRLEVLVADSRGIADSILRSFSRR